MKKRGLRKRILSFVLTTLMVVGAFSMSNMKVYAAVEYWCSKLGRGTLSDNAYSSLHHTYGEHDCGFRLVHNEGIIKEYTTSPNTGTPVIENNDGTVYHVNSLTYVTVNNHFIYKNDGWVGTNYGNKPQAYEFMPLPYNGDKILEYAGININNGTIENNYGFIYDNSAGGVVKYNYGKIYVNSGTVEHQFDKFTFSLPEGYTSSESEFYAERGGDAVEFTITKADESLPDFIISYSGIDASIVKIETGRYQLTNNDNSGTTTAKNIELHVDNSGSHVHETITHHEAVLATCVTAGNVEYWECSCGEALDTDGNVLPSIVVAATGNHDFGEQGTDEKCASCQIKNINYSGLTITAEDVDYTGTAQTATISGIESSSYDVADNIKTDAGTYTITLTGKGEYAGTRTVEWKINKANPTCVAPTGLTATYGQTLSAITLANPGSNTNGAWTWKDGTQTVGNVGTNTFTAKFAPDDSTNYKTVENIEVTVTVGQADTEISVPGSFSKTYGDSSFALNATKTGDGILTYVSSDTNVVTVDASGNVTIAGAGTATVTVSMAATTNCKAATDKTVTITVEKATSISGAPGTTRSEQVKSGKKVSDIELPDGWVWSDDSKDTVLSTTAGEIQTATAIYTAADATNYTEAAKSVTVTITMSACSHPVDKVREVIDVDPTCTVAGKKHKVCDECGLEIESNITIAALGHAPGEAVKENVVDATCTTDGSYDLVVYCSVCGDKLSTTPVTVEKLGHTQAEAVKENVIAPTCTEDGSFDEVIKCSVCGEELSKTSRIDPKTGHTAQTPVKENEVAPTCTTAGSYDSVTYCHCGVELGRDTVTIPALGHKWDNGTIIKQPTATEAGKKQYTCLNDSSHKKTENISATGTPAPSQNQNRYDDSDENSSSTEDSFSALDSSVLIKKINSASSGSTVEIDRRYNRQFLSNAEMKALLKKGTVALRMQYSYNGVEYDITIPAGAALDDSIPFYGPLYLASHFRATKNVVKSNANTVNMVTSGKAIKGVVTGKYVVNRGDSLYRIARKFGTTIGDLRQKNPQIKNINVIRPGQEINI